MNCTSCEALWINGVFSHETGCPNQGKSYKQSRSIYRYYVGIRKETHTRHSFVTSLDPTPHYYPEFAYCIGPFKTRRASVWAAKNPCGWSHVSEAEILSKKAIV